MNKTVITPTELYQRLIEKLSFPNIHPLHKAMLLECCENAIKNCPEKDDESLIALVHLAFLSCHSTLKGILSGTFQATDAETATINYRDQTFIINKDSGFLK